MTGIYQGHFQFNQLGMLMSAPQAQGVYYCGSLNSQNQLIPAYIGRAKGNGVTINSRLNDHLRDDHWSGVTHFGYILCSTDQETIALEANEIASYKPIYNTIGK